MIGAGAARVVREGGSPLDADAVVVPHTPESGRHPGLFLWGQLLDAFGPIGGYNFSLAWAHGR